jgi:hypothetical protein
VVAQDAVLQRQGTEQHLRTASTNSLEGLELA